MSVGQVTVHFTPPGVTFARIRLQDTDIWLPREHVRDLPRVQLKTVVVHRAAGGHIIVSFRFGDAVTADGQFALARFSFKNGAYEKRLVSTPREGRAPTYEEVLAPAVALPSKRKMPNKSE